MWGQDFIVQCSNVAGSKASIAPGFQKILIPSAIMEQTRGALREVVQYEETVFVFF